MFIWVIFFYAVYLLCARAGAAEKTLTDADYEKWGTLGVKELSVQGRWCSYGMTYEHHKDTLFLQRTTTKERYVYPKGRDGRFGGEILFACMQGDSLQLRYLVQGKQMTLTEVSRYDLLLKGKYVAALLNDGTLKVLTANGMVVDSVAGVRDYVLNSDTSGLLYNRHEEGISELGCIQFGKYAKSTIASGSVAFSRLVWHDRGKSVVFLKDGVLQFYRFSDKRLLSFDAGKLTALGLELASGFSGPITIAADGKKVFFSVVKSTYEAPTKKDTIVQVWNGNDNCLYPARQQLERYGDLPKLAVWFPETGVFRALGDDFPNALETGKGDYALFSDSYRYGREPKYLEAVDYYIKNVHTGAFTLLLEHQPHDENQVRFSPYSNEVLYYKDKHWWLYTPETDSTLNLTKRAAVAWDNSSIDAPHQFGVYGNAGWTTDGKYTLLYDAFDLWQVALDGSGCVRLTKGREDGLVYRISEVEYGTRRKGGYELGQGVAFDLSKPLVFTILHREDWSTGYGVYTLKEGMQTLIYGDRYFSELRKSDNGCFAYSQQSFSESPSLEFIRAGEPKSHPIYASNASLKDYQSKAELVYYTNKSGQRLKGALFYPKDYNPSKQYPMVVYIYDQQSKFLHHYVNPTLLNLDGFAVSNFTLQDYFVLLPDIYYQLGDTGGSALDCVTAAVKAVLSTGKVDSKRIGLIGHSFGGYQTDYIITQTDMFAAAVSGAGIGDTQRHYFGLTHNGIAGGSMWWYESQQLRMGTSFYAAKEAYWRTNPIVHADAIKTPLLLWVGASDHVIPFEQSLTFYLALRRLEKKSVFLVYPQGDHSLTIPVQQKDLSQRVIQWFDYYLKDKTDVGWITVGTSTD